MRCPSISLKRFAPLAVLGLWLLTMLGGCSPLMRGNLALAKGDHAEALAQFNEALRQEPDSVIARLRMGQAYMDMGDCARAEAMFDNALLLRPGQPEALFYLGLSRIGKGEAQAALTELTRYTWPDKFMTTRAVREEAQRLLGHPELPPAEIMQSLKAALASGQQEQQRWEREMFLGVGWN